MRLDRDQLTSSHLRHLHPMDEGAIFLRNEWISCFGSRHLDLRVDSRVVHPEGRKWIRCVRVPLITSGLVSATWRRRLEMKNSNQRKEFFVEIGSRPLIGWLSESFACRTQVVAAPSSGDALQFLGAASQPSPWRRSQLIRRDDSGAQRSEVDDPPVAGWAAAGPVDSSGATRPTRSAKQQPVAARGAIRQSAASTSRAPTNPSPPPRRQLLASEIRRQTATFTWRHWNALPPSTNVPQHFSNGRGDPRATRLFKCVTWPEPRGDTMKLSVVDVTRPVAIYFPPKLTVALKKAFSCRFEGSEAPKKGETRCYLCR